MRTYDIPYVQRGPASYNEPVKSIEDLDIREITQKYLCGKAGGRVSECMKCKAQCQYGKKAIELLYPPPMVKSNLNVAPGKTLIEMAREENARLRAAAAEAEEKKKIEKPKKKGRGLTIDGWYDKAYESDDPLKWIMEAFNLNARKAKQKVYAYQFLHPELKETKPMWEKKEQKVKREKTEEIKSEENTKPEEKPATSSEENIVVNQVPEKPETKKLKSSDMAFAPFETKLDKLMKQKDEYKQKIEYYQKLYEETKTKIDTVFAALNILDE